MRAAHPLLPTTPSPIPVHPQRGRGPALSVPRARAPACAGRVRASPSSDCPQGRCDLLMRHPHL